MDTATETIITEEILDEAFSYDAYTQLIDNLIGQDRTTNEDNRPEMLEYTKLNIQRSTRWNKRAEISEELTTKLHEFPQKMIWLVITEGWCGDASQSLPFLNKMAELSENIDLKLILRDQYPDVMDAFLTNGSRSIPKLIALNTESLDVIGTWGPRPVEAQKTYMNERANPDIDNSKATENLHLWYARNKGKAIQNEFMELLDEWKRG
jgi:hypothetical protein